VVITDGLWRRLGAASSVVGQSIRLGEDRVYTIVGVLPQRFEFPQRTNVFIPLPRPNGNGGASSAQTCRDQRSCVTAVSMLGKLRRGVTRDEARAEMAILSARLGSVDRSLVGHQIVVRNEMIERPTGGRLGVLIALFMGSAFFVMFIVCSNVANLMLIRADDRRTEMAMRAALGASRARLMQLTLTESALLAAVAGLLGTSLSVVGVKVAQSLMSTQNLPSWLALDLDERILAFSLAVTFLVTIAVGLYPARVATAFDLASTLKTRGGIGRSRREARVRQRGLVVQLALSFALFMSAALMARSYQRLATFDFGYPAHRLISVRPLFDGPRYQNHLDRVRFADEVASSLNGAGNLSGTAVWAEFGLLETRSTYEYMLLPAHERRGTVARNRNGVRGPLYVDGSLAVPNVRSALDRTWAVSEGYFALLGVRMITGRAFARGDSREAPAVAIVNRTFAQLAFPGLNPIGRALHSGPDGDRFIVVGVVQDIPIAPPKEPGSDAQEPMIYVPMRQVAPQNPQVLSLAVDDVEAAKRLTEGAVRRLDPWLPVAPTHTLAREAENSMYTIRVFGSLITGFAAAGLLLAMIGAYGLISFGISQRRRELGIRLALGGTARRVISLVVMDGVRFTFIGIAIGLVISAASSRLLRVLLFGTSALDPMTFVVVSLAFAGVAILACYLPARRVATIDPLVALRAE
jgi:putative ABC transport system permease protein